MQRYLFWSLRRVLWRFIPRQAKRHLRGSGRKLHLLRMLTRFMGR